MASSSEENDEDEYSEEYDDGGRYKASLNYYLNAKGSASEDIVRENVLEGLMRSYSALKSAEAKQELKEVLERLSQEEVHIDTRDKHGKTVLHMLLNIYGEYSEHDGHMYPQRALAMMKLLLECGANVNIHVADNLGNTPLHCAARNCHKGIVELLIRRGAAVYCKNNAGKTPIDIAEHMQHTLPDLVDDYSKIKKMLEEALLRKTFQDIWTLESAEYDSYLQWLPKEMLEATIAFSTDAPESDLYTGNPYSFHSVPTVQYPNTTLKRKRTEGKEEEEPEPKCFKK